MRVIAFSGPDGAGKTTLAKAIQSTSRFDRAIGVEFAFALRKEVSMVLQPFSPPEHHRHNETGIWEKPTPPWARDLLRGWGDWRRSQDINYWVDRWRLAVNVVRDEIPEDQSLLILNSDLRYINELEAVQALGGTVVYLDDASVPDHELRHELLDVRTAADLGFTINSKARMWPVPEQVLEALDLV